ncbi:MAG: hypothetical protein O3C40_04875 [Planctomycetota bacterium]|nr:hypothetical protein [Planctomycetota bacterium]
MTSDRTPGDTTQGQRSTRWLDRAVLCATLLLCAIALAPNVPDPDLWGHVQYGRDWLAQGFHTTATYSYTATGYRWVNHENLAELTLATGMDALGPIGMLIAKCLAGLAVIGLIMWRAKRAGLGLITICVTSLLVAINLTYFWTMRPQLLSWLCYTLLLALLSWCFQGWEGRGWLRWLEQKGSSSALAGPEYSSFRMRFLWLAPVILCGWANSHGGFVAGYCIYVAYLGLRGIEAFSCRGRESFGLLRRLAMMIVAGGLATLINPYGPGLHLWMLGSLGTPRPEIMEWRAPEMFTTLMLPLWLILFSWFAVLLLTRRSRDITHFVIMALTLWQSFLHVRHIPFFAIPFGFWMAIHVESVLRRFNIVRDETDQPRELAGNMSRRLQWTFGTVFALAFLLLGFRLHVRLREMPVERKDYPVAAFQFIADQDLQGRMVVTFNWAQYAIAAFGPRDHSDDGLLISFDGRFRTCYPQEVIDMNFDFILGDLEARYRSPESPPLDDERVLEFGDPEIVLINREQPHGVNVMFRNQDRWTLLYQDRIAQVWGLGSKYGDPNSSHYIAQDRRQITDDEQTGTVPWPALPVRPRQNRQLAQSDP